ncbi:hypothetical protein [Microcystis phage MaeS]|nr:hypothetical protein [Microcystis phage MaeS]
MRKLKNKIVCIVGESGSGKSTLYEKLREKGHKVVDSYTTRAPRFEGELGHTFVTQEEFDALRPDFAAYTEFDEYEYATTFQQLEESEFYIIDPAGVEDLSEKIGRENFIVVYIVTFEENRFTRMAKERGKEVATQRIHHDREKFRTFIEEKNWNRALLNNWKVNLENNVILLEQLYKQANQLEA